MHTKMVYNKYIIIREGYLMLKICNICGEESEENAQFCQNCGEPFYEQEKVSETNFNEEIDNLEHPSLYNTNSQNKIYKIVIAILISIIILFILGVIIKEFNNTDHTNETSSISTSSKGYSDSSSGSTKTFYSYQFIFDGELYDMTDIDAFSYITLNSSNNSFYMYLDYDNETHKLSCEYDYFSSDNGEITYSLTNGDKFIGVLMYDTYAKEYYILLDNTEIIVIYK